MTDSRTQNVYITAQTNDPQALGSAAARAMDKKPIWNAQAANGNILAGANG